MTPTHTSHIFEQHPLDGPCNTAPGHCPICDGGLQLCLVCHGAEGSLPSECPGVEMPFEISDRIYSGNLDFIHGRWVSKK